MSGIVRHVVRYAAAVVLVVLAGFVLRFPAAHYPNTGAFVFCLTILLAAWYGGLGPGLLATGLIVLVTLPPSFNVEREIRLAVFLFYGGAASVLLGALQRSRCRAEAASRAKDAFVAALSHELRTPLTPILAEVSVLLADPRTPAAQRPVLELTHRNITLEARLIDDLLDIGRARRGELTLERERVDAHILVHRAVDLCHEQVEGAKLRLELDLSAPEHHVRADPVRLQQVIWNLVRNAANFTPPGGTVSVQTRNELGASGTLLTIAVSDTGIGIAPRDRRTIFNAFQRGCIAGAQEFGGLGLGLAISKAVVDAHSGRLTVSSAGEGQGSTFTVALPISQAVAVPVVPPDSATRPHDGHRSRILLVEDDVKTAHILARLLGASGFDVTTAASVAEASDAAQAATFDVVVSDIGLPDGTGWELMPRLRARGIARGIALTGFGLDEDVKRSHEAGFLAHLTKPIDFPKLEEAIRQAALA